MVTLAYFKTNDDKKLPVIKQYGLQRSGTNVIKFLLMNHYHVDVWTDRGGWKHGYYHAPEQENDLLISIKNPYDWIVSIYNYSNARVPYLEYVKRRYAFEGLAAVNPIQHWNTMNRHWLTLTLKEKLKTFVVHRDLVVKPEETAQKIADLFGLERNEKPFYTPEKKVEPNAQEGNRPFDLDYYAKEGYRKVLTQETIDFIDSQLDHDLMKMIFG